MKEHLVLKIGKYNISVQTLIFVLGIVGIVLIGLSPMFSKATATPKSPATEVDAKAYAKELEERLGAVLREVDGVGEVKVLVTLKNGYSYVYAKSEKINNDTMEDVRAADEKKTQEKQVTEQTYVLVDGSGGKEPLVTMQLEPEVKGVVVVCEGGDRPGVVGTVVDTVKVALNIPSTRISVSKLTVK